MAIEIVHVTVDNVEQAISLACEIFKPNDHFAIRQELMASLGLEPETSEVYQVMEIHRAGYLMALEDGVPAGVSGYYSQKGHEEDVWLGWTGVSNNFGGKGIGEAVVRAAFASAELNGIKNLRIWTSDEEQFASARRLYARLGFNEEPYRADAPANEGASLARVFTKAADPEKVADSWVKSSYRLPDLEIFDMPRLDQVARNQFERHQVEHRVLAA